MAGPSSSALHENAVDRGSLCYLLTIEAMLLLLAKLRVSGEPIPPPKGRLTEQRTPPSRCSIRKACRTSSCGRLSRFPRRSSSQLRRSIRLCGKLSFGMLVLPRPRCGSALRDRVACPWSQVSRLSHSPPSRARRGQSVLPNIRSRKALPMGDMRLTRKFATGRNSD